MTIEIQKAQVCCTTGEFPLRYTNLTCLNNSTTSQKCPFMNFDKQLNSATLIKRYKRFLADVTLEDGSEHTIHCPNTGSMSGCAETGDTVWFSTSDNLKRKYPFTWELTQTSSDDFICVNTQRANQLVEEALSAGIISELVGFESLRREVKYGKENSRIDVLLNYCEQPDTYIEVKSVTLLENGQGFFPDAVTTRGQKHLRELTEIVQEGHRAVLLFAVMHTGINSVSPASHIDKEYTRLLKEAEEAGVIILAYRASVSPEGMKLSDKLDVSL